MQSDGGKPERQGRTHTQLRYFIYPALLVLAVGAIFTLAQRHPANGAAPISHVVIGRDYYVTVALIELDEKDPTGKAWDALDESGPDIFVELWWKGNRIYQSNTKSDTFLAKWSNAELNLRTMAINGGNTSMDDIVRAARLNIKEGEEIEIRVYDYDILTSTLAGTKTIRTTDLVIGDTTFESPAPSIKRMVVRVSDMGTAVDPLR